MVFVYGGAFYLGTQLKMDAARLGHVDDVVMVAVNYRVGTIGEYSIWRRASGEDLVLHVAGQYIPLVWQY